MNGCPQSMLMSLTLLPGRLLGSAAHPGASIYVPKSFIALIILIVAGLGVGVRYTIERSRKGRYVGRYQKLGSTTLDRGAGFKPMVTPLSYQNSTVDYALPPKPNVVTYCVIDGRLVDT
jgi:hypothetical protein